MLTLVVAVAVIGFLEVPEPECVVLLAGLLGAAHHRHASR